LIKTVGGNAPKSHVYRVMAKQFSDEHEICALGPTVKKTFLPKIGDCTSQVIEK